MCLAVRLQCFVTAACAAPFLAKCEAGPAEVCHGNDQFRDSWQSLCREDSTREHEKYNL